MTSSHPPLPLKPWNPFPARRLLPIYPPADPLNYPSLPNPPRHLPSSAPFTLSTHAIPAAHLRRGPRLPIPNLPPDDLPSPERANIIGKLRELFLKNIEDPAFKNDQHENILWNVLNRYVRKDLTSSNSTGLTLFFSHANGYPKEIWEPILARIFASPIACMVDEVWTWECVQHGDAGLINANVLTGFFDWTDNTRDVLNFLLHFLPPMPLDKSLPIHLNRLPLKETQHRISHGYHRRTLILIGHSFGGTSLVLGAFHYPKLHSSLILVDPTLIRPGMPEGLINLMSKWSNKAITNALLRKDTWESKEEAFSELSSSPYYNAWDRDMLVTYVEHGLYNATIVKPGGEKKYCAKLKLLPFHEALVFAGGDAPFEGFTCLPGLDERIRLHWIVSGAKGAPEFGPPGAQQERVWTRPKNSSNTRITRAGHLVPQEGSTEFAQDLINFLEQHYSPIRTIRSAL